MTDSVDERALVEGLLRAAELSLSDEEIALFVGMYPVLRAKADRIYELDLGEDEW